MNDTLAWIRGRLEAGEDAEIWDDPEFVGRCCDLSVESPAAFGEVERAARKALAGRAAQLWLGRLTKLRKERDKAQADKRRALEVAEQRRRSEEAGMPSFALADDAEIGIELYRRVAAEHDGPVLAGFGLGKTKQLWVCKGGLYRALTEEHLRVRVMRWSGAPVGDEGKPLMLNEGRIRGVVAAAHAYAANDHGYEVEWFAEAPAGVTFEDAFVAASADGADVEPSPLLPEHRQRWALPFKYDTGATCPVWEEFLRSVLTDGTPEADMSAILALQEFIGACLLREAGAAGVALVLLGSGANGKSTILKVIRRLFGGGAVSVPPQAWGDDPKTIPFATARINIVEELPPADVMASADFKAIVDGAFITRRPLYQEPLSFVAKPGHIFAANELPYATDPTDGFWRRWMLLRFDKQFDTDGTRPELPRADATLQEQLLAELPGIAMWAVVGARRFFQQRKKLTEVSRSKDEVKEWRHDSDRVGTWFEERCVPAAYSWTPSLTLYQNYKAWCGSCGYSPYGLNKWAAAMTRLGVQKKRDNGSKWAVELSVQPGLL